jgi:predicted ArsR family transcriptional regulator
MDAHHTATDTEDARDHESEEVSVTGKFGSILAGLMDYMAETHGEEAAHRLFFELYSHTFSHLSEQHGDAAVDAYWEHLSTQNLEDLDALVAAQGLRGMAAYWGEVGEQEQAGFATELTEDTFRIEVRHCPPRTWFRDQGYPAYERYAEHCRVLYTRMAQRHGFDAEYQPPDDEAGHCCVLTFSAGSST